MEACHRIQSIAYLFDGVCSGTINRINVNNYIQQVNKLAGVIGIQVSNIIIFRQYNFYLSLNDIGKYRPLEINYDKYRVDFDKGCFRGQEIIARMKYLGVDRRKFITIISNKEILSEKKLRILGNKLKYKNFYVYHCSINNDYMSEYKKNNPHVMLV